MKLLASYLAFVGLAFGLAYCVSSCNQVTPQQHAANVAEASAYGAAQLACVEKYKPDNAKVTACRNAIKDGGADGN